jgi:hypothetical protein
MDELYQNEKVMALCLPMSLFEGHAQKHAKQMSQRKYSVKGYVSNKIGSISEQHNGLHQYALTKKNRVWLF